MSVATLFESVQDVWIIWCLSVLGLVIVTRVALARMRWRSFADFLGDEHGASYVLPYVLSLPMLILLVCLAMQGTFILMAKIGTVHAAYAAGRAAIVWQGAVPDSDNESRDLADFYADRAAVVGMVPFAAGIKQPQVERMLLTTLPTSGGLSVLTRGSFLYDPMYRRLAGISESDTTSPVIKNPSALAKQSYIRQKVRVAAFATNATINGNRDVTPFNEGVEVEVSYKMPLQVPLVARFFDNRAFRFFFLGEFYSRTITTTVTLPSEAALTATGRLEVPYYPNELKL